MPQYKESFVSYILVMIKLKQKLYLRCIKSVLNHGYDTIFYSKDPEGFKRTPKNDFVYAKVMVARSDHQSQSDFCTTRNAKITNAKINFGVRAIQINSHRNATTHR